MTHDGHDQLRELARRALQEHGLLADFSDQALRELANAPAPSSSEPGIRDLRKLLWCSIDNDESLDLDQLSVAAPGDAGTVKVLVAVADVDAWVQRGSALDEHARTNTTSVYTAAGIFPMLPERMSTDLSSLADQQDRLAIVTELSVDAQGAVREFALYRALVNNRAKLAYDSVAAWLEGHAAAPPRLARVAGLEENLRLQDQVAQRMKARRHSQGALTLQANETRPVFAGDQLTDVRADQQNRAKDLIEDFMVAVNNATAQFLERAGSPSLRRVLRSPARWQRIVELAQSVGEQLPQEPDAVALEQVLQRRRAASPEHFAQFSLGVIKLLGRGEYVVAAPGQSADGHFGLAVGEYTHATAPNRRFSDLVAQRLIKAALAKRASPYSLAELADIAQRCNACEESANKVERQVNKSAAALLLQDRVGEQFDALVTGASDKGTWVRVFHPAVEGKLVRGAPGLDIGQRLRVQLLRTDVEHGYIDFARVGGP